MDGGELKTTHYNDGTAITLITDSASWKSTSEDSKSECYCWYNNDSITYKSYGILYNFML